MTGREVEKSIKGSPTAVDPVFISIQKKKQLQEKKNFKFVLNYLLQVYLEREPGANTGCIKWRINFGCCGLLMDEVTIRLSCVEDYGGEVVATLMGTPGQKRVRYPIGEA